MQSKLNLRRPASSRLRTVVCSATAQPKKAVKLTYFPLPGRAECARLMLTMGMIPFDDCRISREEWPELKPHAPYGQLPLLEVHGKKLAQSNAIDRYVAKMSGFYPTEGWDQARVDSIVAYMEEFLTQFYPVFVVKDPEAREAAVKQVLDGPLHTRFERLSNMIAELKPNEFLVGSQFTWADVAVYCTVCNIVGGLFPGVPKDLFVKKYPKIEEYRNRIASLPAIKAYFDRPQHVSDDMRRSYKPAPQNLPSF